MSTMFDITGDPRWLMVVDGWNADQEPSIEAVLALVNGYSGTRAAVEEGSRVSMPAMFVNGVFNAATELVAQAAARPEHQVIAAPTPELVVAPNWSHVQIMADGARLTLDDAELIEQLNGLPHRLPIRRAPHDHGDERSGRLRLGHGAPMTSRDGSAL